MKAHCAAGTQPDDTQTLAHQLRPLELLLLGFQRAIELCLV